MVRDKHRQAGAEQGGQHPENDRSKAAPHRATLPPRH
jgi:hypothetical protein